MATEKNDSSDASEAKVKGSIRPAVFIGQTLKRGIA